MSTSSASTELIVPETDCCENLAEFVRWATAQMRLELTTDGDVAKLQLPDSDQPAFDGQTELRLALGDAAGDSRLEPIGWESRFGVWLLERLRAGGTAAHACPQGQLHVRKVNPMPSRIFLLGCSLRTKSKEDSSTWAGAS